MTIEFKPWVKFIDGLGYEDLDGFGRCFGRLNLFGLDPPVLAKVIAWLESDYSKTLLTKEQVIDWANTLASYWYPKLNTDVVDMTGQAAWPVAETEKAVRRELKGLQVANPLVVIRGNPYGTVIYNVFTVDTFAENGAAAPAGQTPKGAAVTQSPDQRTRRFPAA